MFPIATSTYSRVIWLGISHSHAAWLVCENLLRKLITLPQCNVFLSFSSQPEWTWQNNGAILLRLHNPLLLPPHCPYFHLKHFLPGEPDCMSIVPETRTQTMCSLYGPAWIVPNLCSRSSVSHVLWCQKEWSYCSSPVTHSQTQPLCRLHSHFLLGEVSHCNKASRGSQGRVSIPGWGKWSVPNHSSFFCAVKI